MNLHLPDYKSKEDGVLYIIGNGFDLYHGLRSRYIDFHNWLLKDHKDYVDNMQYIYPKIKDNEYELWSDFELALESNRDLLELHDHYKGQDDLLSKDKQKTYAAEQIKKIINQTQPLLEEWAQSFEYDKIEKVLPLGKNSKYITFNYTKTLEEVYNIKGEDHVLHIHGVVGEGNIITGYGYDRNETPVGSPIERYSQETIKNELTKLRKPTTSIWLRHSDFFEKLGHITTIIVIGHSLADVDRPYFEFLLQQEPSYTDIKWQYWVHNEEAIKGIQERIKDLCFRWSDFDEKMNEERWRYFIMDKYK